MAQKPDGKSAKTERLVFTRPAVDRISAVVLEVEAGDRNQAALRFDRVASQPPLPLKLATFTGNWQTGTYKTVTLKGSTATASVYNWCNPAVGGDTASTTKTRYVIFGKVQGTHSAVEIQLKSTSETCVMTLGDLDLTTLGGYSAGVVQLLGHSAGDVTTNNTACATLTWYSVTTCSTAAA